ncbi:peptidoglycan DD-metalloendopeptidase family protein [Porticoccaceae bacterium]|jgi:murein DD-endopeptidase MepM/ murein hydrolase activator NlpD|nr:peptidoglycan DD-metalloendopeptidase family protein [Porticoccaceae bacterium]
MSNLQKLSNFLLLIIRDFPRSHLVLASAITGCLLALIIYPQDSTASKRQILEPLAIVIPAPTPKQTLANEPTGTVENFNLSWKEQKVAPGDNLSTLFQRAKLSPKDVYQVSSSKAGRSLLNLFPGEKLRFGIDNNGQLTELHYVKSALESHVFERNGNSYSSEKRLRQPDTLLSYREGVIEDSLYLSAAKADLPDKLIMELANIFGWDIDFVFDIRQGDSFSLLYEDRYLDGEKLSSGNIIAASFTNRGKTYQAVRYTNKQGRSNYFTPEGRSMRKAFLRSPVNFMYISSSFNPKRFHPIQKKWKAHRGIDYRAKTGTPVRAAGDGTVIASTSNRFNGKYVFIQHGNSIVTKYLHLSKRSVRRGSKVSQGQVIGLVGATGLAEAPHLHYEFVVNGVHRNPRTVKLPQAQPIASAEKTRFQQATAPLLAELVKHQQNIQLAAAKSASSSAN